MATLGEASPADGWGGARATLGRHFLRDLEGLWGDTLRLAAIVEDTLTRSVCALCDGRADLADEVCRAGHEAGGWEARIEGECLTVLARHQPVASDLRRVAAVLKISGDLERIGDLARHIAKRVGKLTRAEPGAPTPPPVPPELEALADEALRQVRDGLDALARSDADLARAVIATDGGVDRRYHDLIKELKQSIRDRPEHVDHWLRLINTARNLERTADHASKIAESVIYLKEGVTVRHAPPA